MINPNLEGGDRGVILAPLFNPGILKHSVAFY